MSTFICKECGKEIEDKYHIRIYCSRSCHDRGRAKNFKESRPKVICKQCGSIFSIQKCMLTNKNRTNKGWFCSNRCQTRYYANIRIDPNNKIERTCKQCGCIFIIHKCQLNEKYRFKGIFCSRSCRYKYDLSPGGRWYTEDIENKYNSTFNKSFKEGIRERDNYTCALCGKEDSKDIHHIDYNKKNSVENNCIVLCSSCHARTNFNREEWKKIFEEIINSRRREFMKSFIKLFSYPVAPLQFKARELNLGVPVTTEVEYKGEILQGFSGGWLHCVKGDWQNIKQEKW